MDNLSNGECGASFEQLRPSSKLHGICLAVCVRRHLLISISLFSGASKLSGELGLGNPRRSPWSVPPDSSRSPVRERPDRVTSSTYLQASRPSLLESQPFHRNTLKKQPVSLEEKVRPYDFKDLGLSDSRGFVNGRSIAWNNADRCCSNPDSLFSASSRAADEQFNGKNTWQSNNWVNFLDASKVNDSAVTSNKTMAEIWDAGQSPGDSDGWSVYPSVAQAQPTSSEADAVDALFSQMPAYWSGPCSGRESPFSSQEARWAPLMYLPSGEVDILLLAPLPIPSLHHLGLHLCRTLCSRSRNKIHLSSLRLNI